MAAAFPTAAPWIATLVLGLAGVAWGYGAPGRRAKRSASSCRGSCAAAGCFPPGPTGRRQPERRPPPRVVLVVRIPQIAWPRPSLLDLYIARRYLTVFLLAFFSLIGVFYISTFIDLADKLFRGSTTTAMLLRFFYFQTPQFVYYIVPLAALLATLVTIGVLTKNSELIVMRACGISLYRSAMPLLLFSIALSGVLFELQDRVLADSNREAERLEGMIRGWPPQTFGGSSIADGSPAERRSLLLRVLRSARQHLQSPVDLPSRPRLAPGGGDATSRATSASSSRTASWRGARGTAGSATSRRRGRPARRRVRTAPLTNARCRSRRPSYFKSDDPDAERMSYRRAARLHRRSCRRAATTRCPTWCSCSARSRFRSSR